MNINTFLILSILVWSAGEAYADVYRCTGSDGKTIYQAIPCTTGTQKAIDNSAAQRRQKIQVQPAQVKHVAEWVQIGRNADGEATFVDSRSLQKNGANVVMDVLVNRDNGFAYESQRTLTSFDCKERRIQILSVATYQQTDITGGKTESIKPDLGWGGIRPQSIGEKQWEFACSQKSSSGASVATQYSPSDPRTIFKAGALFESDQLTQLTDKHFPGAKYRRNGTKIVTYQNQTFVIAVQKQNEVGIPAIYKIVSVFPQ